MFVFIEIKLYYRETNREKINLQHRKCSNRKAQKRYKKKKKKNETSLNTFY